MVNKFFPSRGDVLPPSRCVFVRSTLNSANRTSILTNIVKFPTLFTTSTVESSSNGHHPYTSHLLFVPQVPVYIPCESESYVFDIQSLSSSQSSTSSFPSQTPRV